MTCGRRPHRNDAAAAQPPHASDGPPNPRARADRISGAPKRHVLSCVLPLALFASACALEEDVADFDAEAIGIAKIAVCHTNNGTYGYTLIDVSESALDTHLGHGDVFAPAEGGCESVAIWLTDACFDDYVAGGSVGTLDPCFCDAGYCADCETFTNPAPCKDLE